ncbi:hypothetical protein RAB80_006697 [Fusarium oxysporum f. sp. vasinfectum]|nr:hypothetical protein RAB80_006697 [Fusarium oxysporum f. sp. vasinfectum]KAK2924255.1 hypothetical protein FoTM2_016413 [Fusarium oxysporum f. sp. vasinfectum]
MSNLGTSKELPENEVSKDTSTKDLLPSQEIFATPTNEHFLTKYSYHDLNYLEHEIRLVHVFKKPGSDLIHGNLLPPQKLADISGKYHTISYCAGSAKNTRPMILQGLEFNVFANLDCALQETLAYWSTTKCSEDDCILWIDQATDPRDKIFSLLGLAHPGYNITPNYSKSNTLSHVLIDTAIKVILFEGDLSILLHALQLAKAPSCQLPSWVPDWTSSTVSTLSVFGHSENFPLASITTQIRRDAIGSIRFGRSTDGGQNTVLIVKGLRFGILETFCKELLSFGGKRFMVAPNAGMKLNWVMKSGCSWAHPVLMYSVLLRKDTNSSVRSLR